MPGQRSRRQRELLDALRTLVLAEGFAHLTLDDLAARLHCSKSTLYALAGSKDELARVVVGDFFRTATADVEARVAAAEPGPPQLVAYLDAVADALRPAGRAFLDDVAASPQTRELYGRNARAAARRIHEVVADGVAAGAFRDDVHTAFLAELVGLAITAIQSGELGRRAGLTDADAFAELTTTVVAALSPTPTLLP